MPTIAMRRLASGVDRLARLELSVEDSAYGQSYAQCAVERLEVVDAGRRRRWSEEEKLRIVAESLSGPRLVSATARRYGISTSLLFTWRRACRQSTSQPSDAGFVPAVIMPDVRPAVPASSGRIEIVLANRRRVIVDGGVDIAALCQLVEALERR